MTRRLLLVNFLFVFLSAVAHADGRCHVKSVAAIIKVFDQGIVLNDKFKKSVVEGNQAAYQSLRIQVEKLNEEDVIPCVERAGEILSKTDASKLAHKLLELVISYENSADETISYSLGLIFGANPQSLESAIKSFSPSEQKLISERLKIGWLNAKSKFKNEVIEDRERRLLQLGS